MEREREMGFTEKVGLFVEKHKPGKSKHSLTGASYTLKDVGPFDIDLSGAPKNKGTMAILMLIGTYLVYWFWYGWVNDGTAVFKDLVLLENMTWMALFAGCALVIILFATLIDLHKGSFNQYIMIVELRLRSLLGKPLKRVELKITPNYQELYNPAVGGFWRSAESYRAEADKEESEKSEESKESEKSKFKPVDMEDEAQPFYELDGKRFSSMRDMQDIMKMALVEGEVVETKDEIKDILTLKREFADLSEKIKLPFTVTMCECDAKGGKIYPIFISKHSLFGGSTALKGSYVEFRTHELAQRTWAGIVSKDNVRAGVGEGVEIGMYKFYDPVPDELLLSGKKEEGIRFAPIIFVTASDAQAEKMMDDFRSNETREGTVQQDLIDAEVIYDNSIADQLFETLKLVISRLKRKERSEEEIRRDHDFDNKDVVHQGLEKALITQRAGKPGRFSNINLFSHKSVKYVFYCIAALGVIFISLYILHYYVGLDIGWLFGDLPTDDIPPEEDDWTSAAKFVWMWFK